MNKTIFITGVNGVGKSAIMPYLINLLSEDFCVFDFDQRGVPENADKNWRISESQYWINESKRLALENKKTIICGFVKLTDLAEGENVEWILLDAPPEIIEQRLKERYSKEGIFDETQKVIGKPIQEFISGNLYILEKMRQAFQEKNCVIIDTSNLTPKEVAEEVVKNIKASKN